MRARIPESYLDRLSLTKIVCVALTCFMLIPESGAGRLDNFEKKANTPRPKKSSISGGYDYHSRHHRHPLYCDCSACSGIGFYGHGHDDVLSGFFAWLFFSKSRHTYGDDPLEEGEPGGDLVAIHQLGSATVPYVRVDGNWQHIDSNLDALDVRIEAGYEYFAFHGRHTLYTERNPDDDFTINQYYGVFRLGDAVPETKNGSWEVGIGMGAVQQIGNEENSAFAATIPIKVYPAEWLGLEFRPAWYRPQERMIGDYDVSASLGYRFIQLRVGYRWLWIQGFGHDLNGPYAGVSASF